MASETGLAYSLCVTTGIGAVLNLFNFIMKLKPIDGNSVDCKQHKLFICCGVFTNVFYFCSAVAILVLAINNDDDGEIYSDVDDHVIKKNPCLVGGFFALFGAFESLFLLTLRSILFALGPQSKHGETQPYLQSENDKNDDLKLTNQAKQINRDKRHKVAYCSFQIIQSVIWSVICFIPLIAQSIMPEFPRDKLNDTRIHFQCVPLALISEAGTSTAAWRYSCSIVVVLGWCPVTIATVSTIFISVSLCNGEKFRTDCWRWCEMSKRRVIVFAQLALEVTLWIVIMVVASVAFFTDGRQLSKVSTQWTLGYLISIVLLWHSAVEFVTMLKRWCPSSGDRHSVETQRSCPDSVTVVSEVSSYRCLHQQCQGQRHYVIKWTDSRMNTQHIGLLKIVPTGIDNRRLWLNEIEADVVLRVKHSNIARNMWSASSNLFSTEIANSTGHIVGRHCMLTCSELFTIGSLAHFMEFGNTDYCITIIRLISEQVARAIDFIHSRHLVHNNITSHCIYIAQYNHELHVVRAVIGNFEHSFKVSSSSSGTSYSLGTQFTAVDIQSFSLLVTELIVTASDRDRLRCRHSNGWTVSHQQLVDNNWLSWNGDALCRLLQLVVNMDEDQHVTRRYQGQVNERCRSIDSRSTDFSRPASGSSRDDTVSRDSSICSCADRVTDIRAHDRLHQQGQGHHQHSRRHSSSGCVGSENGSPWQRAWFSDSESSAFSKVKQTMTSRSSLSCVPNANQQKLRRRLRQHPDSDVEIKYIVWRQHCMGLHHDDVIIVPRGHQLDSVSLMSGESSNSITSSSVASSCNSAHHTSRHHGTSIGTSGRSKRRSVTNGNSSRSLDIGGLVKSASSGGLKAISETGSVGKDACDTVSSKSCALCLEGLCRTDFSHPALRALYSVPSPPGGASTQTDSSAIGSDSINRRISNSSTDSSSSSDSLATRSFSNESG